MSDTTSVEPGELRAAAQAQDGIADDIKDPDDRALRDTRTAAESAQGWSFASALQEIADSWKPALDGLHARLKTGASNLRDTADSHEWNDDWVQQDFEDFDGDMEDVIMSAPASGPGPSAVSSSGDSTRLAPPTDTSLPGMNGPFADPMPHYTPTGVHLPPPDSTGLPHPGPASADPMPTYDPDESRAEPGRSASSAPVRTDDTPFG